MRGFDQADPAKLLLGATYWQSYQYEACLCAKGIHALRHTVACTLPSGNLRACLRALGKTCDHH